MLARYAGVTDPGRRRRRNEDAYVAEPPLFAIADGMGGAQAGEVASRLAAGALEDDGDGMEATRRRNALSEGHIGLASVTQRVEANGGVLQLETTPGSGTRVWVRLIDQEPGARP